MSEEHYNHQETESHIEPDQSTSTTNQLIDFGSDENREATPSNGNEHNGYIVVPPTPQSSVDASAESTRPVTNQEELQKALEEFSGEKKPQTSAAVVAEADSSSAPACSKAGSGSGKACTLCPYYLLGKYYKKVLSNVFDVIGCILGVILAKIVLLFGCLYCSYLTMMFIKHTSHCLGFYNQCHVLFQRVTSYLSWKCLQEVCTLFTIITNLITTTS